MADYPVWFDKTNFKNVLSHLKDVRNLRFLQIGVYTGDASVWLLDNVLTHESSLLVDVDTWKGSDEPAHEHINFENVLQYYKNRLEKYKGKVISWQMNSNEFFIQNPDVKFDFIYIDGDHHAMQVYFDAVNAWKCLNKGGILAFDDYTWSIDDNPMNSPRYGVDKFLVEHDGEYIMLVKNTQLWIGKK